MLTRVVAPASAVSILDVKNFLRVNFARDDMLIQSCINAATEWLDGPEGVLGQAIMAQTWDYKMAAFSTPLRLPFGPVSSITSITYLDENGATQTFLSTNYYLASDALGPYVKPVPDASWPSTYGRDDAVTVRFVAGAATTAAVSSRIKRAIAILANHLYENREVTVDAQRFPSGFGVNELISPIRKVL